MDNFTKILGELDNLHTRKEADYGQPDVTYYNFRKAEALGIPAWQGAFVRLLDKVARGETFIRTGSLRNESFVDTLNDLASYAIICRELFEETLPKEA